MTWNEQAIELGKELAMKVALEITPDETLAVIDEFVHTAVDLEMTGKEKAQWVLNRVIELALDIWEVVAPLVIQALYNGMVARIAPTDYNGGGTGA